MGVGSERTERMVGSERTLSWVPQQLLDRADVVARFQQVRGERVMERVTADRLADTGAHHRQPYRALQRSLVEMVPPLLTRGRVQIAPGCRKHPLPRPFASRAGILQAQRAR